MSIWTPNSFHDVERHNAMEESFINFGGIFVAALFYGGLAFLALGVVSSIGRAALGITYEDIVAERAALTSVTLEEDKPAK